MFFGKEDEREDENKFYYLLLSFDLNSNVMDVIENKIIPFIQKIKSESRLSRPTGPPTTSPIAF
jgi:hypothetical protein